MNQEIADNSRACCNCANGTIAYPKCYCWQHKYCNGDKPYEIPKEAWLKTAERCEEFELGTPEEADVYLELNRIMSEESKDKNPKPMPSCKSCGFYENNCPFIRGKFIPYPNKVCKDYIHSAMKEQKPAEWSEGEEKMWVHDDDLFLDTAKMIVEDSPRKSYGGINKKSIVPWFYSLRERLKSLRPQPHWKPSEEQIQALTVAIDEAARCEEPYWRDSLHDVLLSLHTDLKKLF